MKSISSLIESDNRLFGIGFVQARIKDKTELEYTYMLDWR